jgi:hypothetical protein
LVYFPAALDKRVSEGQFMDLMGRTSPLGLEAVVDLAYAGAKYIFGSEQEFDGQRILSCLPEGHEFGSGSCHALGL